MEWSTRRYLCTVWNLPEIKAGRFSARSAIPGALWKGHLKRTAHKSESCTWRNVKGYQGGWIWWSSLLSLSSFRAQIKRTVMSVVVFVGPYLCVCTRSEKVGSAGTAAWWGIVLFGFSNRGGGWVTFHRFLNQTEGVCVSLVALLDEHKSGPRRLICSSTIHVGCCSVPSALSFHGLSS